MNTTQFSHFLKSDQNEPPTYSTTRPYSQVEELKFEICDYFQTIYSRNINRIWNDQICDWESANNIMSSRINLLSLDFLLNCLNKHHNKDLYILFKNDLLRNLDLNLAIKLCNKKEYARLSSASIDRLLQIFEIQNIVLNKEYIEIEEEVRHLFFKWFFNPSLL